MRKMLFRIVRILLISFLGFYFLSIVYDKLCDKEYFQARVVRDSLNSLSYFAELYLNEVREPKQAVNLIKELEPYFILGFKDNSLKYFLERIRTGDCIFLVSGDLAWVGRNLPKVFWTKGHNEQREILQAKNGRYWCRGSNSPNSPPKADDERYNYRQEHDVIWVRVGRKYGFEPMKPEE